MKTHKSPFVLSKNLTVTDNPWKRLRLIKARLLSITLASALFHSVYADSHIIDPDLILGKSYLQSVESEIHNIDTAQLEEMIGTVEDLVLIDIRETAEIPQSGGTIDAPRVHNVSRGWLEFRVPERVPNRDTPIVVF